MKIIGVIPARWASTRFEGKVLAPLANKPMIQHVWERAKQSSYLEEVIIACDDQRVLNAAEGFGARAMMTSKDHPSGTDRLAEAIHDLPVSIVVNIQGDEPLIQHKIIDDLVQAMINDPAPPMGTVVKYIESNEDVSNPNVVKVVIDQHHYALYFSRSPIPFNRENQPVRYLKHIGIYAFRKDFLRRYKDLPSSSLENIEKLEQLRVLQAGYKIKTVFTDQETIGVDTPEDLKKVERILLGDQ